MNPFLIIAFVVLFVASPGLLQAQVPQLISYQGRVGVDGVNFDGSGQFKFAFVNAAGSTTYWSNDGSSTAGSEPATAVGIPVSKGLYSVLLGDATLNHMSIVPATGSPTWFLDSCGATTSLKRRYLLMRVHPRGNLRQCHPSSIPSLPKPPATPSAAHSS